MSTALDQRRTALIGLQSVSEDVELPTNTVDLIVSLQHSDDCVGGTLLQTIVDASSSGPAAGFPRCADNTDGGNFPGKHTQPALHGVTGAIPIELLRQQLVQPTVGNISGARASNSDRGEDVHNNVDTICHLQSPFIAASTKFAVDGQGPLASAALAGVGSPQPYMLAGSGIRCPQAQLPQPPCSMAAEHYSSAEQRVRRGKPKGTSLAQDCEGKMHGGLRYGSLPSTEWNALADLDDVLGGHRHSLFLQDSVMLEDQDSRERTSAGSARGFLAGDLLSSSAGECKVRGGMGNLEKRVRGGQLLRSPSKMEHDLPGVMSRAQSGPAVHYWPIYPGGSSNSLASSSLPAATLLSLDRSLSSNLLSSQVSSNLFSTCPPGMIAGAMSPGPCCPFPALNTSSLSTGQLQYGRLSCTDIAMAGSASYNSMSGAAAAAPPGAVQVLSRSSSMGTVCKVRMGAHGSSGAISAAAAGSKRDLQALCSHISPAAPAPASAPPTPPRDSAMALDRPANDPLSRCSSTFMRISWPGCSPCASPPSASSGLALSSLLSPNHNVPDVAMLTGQPSYGRAIPAGAGARGLHGSGYDACGGSSSLQAMGESEHDLVGSFGCGLGGSGGLPCGSFASVASHCSLFEYAEEQVAFHQALSGATRLEGSSGITAMPSRPHAPASAAAPAQVLCLSSPPGRLCTLGAAVTKGMGPGQGHTGARASASDVAIDGARSAASTAPA